MKALQALAAALVVFASAALIPHAAPAQSNAERAAAEAERAAAEAARASTEAERVSAEAERAIAEITSSLGETTDPNDVDVNLLTDQIVEFAMSAAFARRLALGAHIAAEAVEDTDDADFATGRADYAAEAADLTVKAADYAAFGLPAGADPNFGLALEAARLETVKAAPVFATGLAFLKMQIRFAVLNDSFLYAQNDFLDFSMSHVNLASPLEDRLSAMRTLLALGRSYLTGIYLYVDLLRAVNVFNTIGDVEETGGFIDAEHNAALIENLLNIAAQAEANNAQIEANMAQLER